MMALLRQLAEPAWLGLVLLAFLPWYWGLRRSGLSWPTLGGFGPRGFRARLAWLPIVARALALACLAVAMARPRTVGGQSRVGGQGVAIVVALDRSGSMGAEDFPGADGLTSRLRAAVRTFRDFAAKRPDDLVGLVAFANDPDVACPLTLDHRALVESAEALRSARAGEDGTNLGDAIAWGLDLLRAASPGRKVLVLITDGRDRPSVGETPPLAPEAAAELARDLGIRLYTIAIGDPGGEGEGPNLALLEQLARVGGGRSFVAADEPTLAGIYGELDQLERSPVRGLVRTRYREGFAPWVAAAIGLLAADCLLTWTRLRRLP
ncbi:MAG: VWA domain-containing protein [Isosphaeraceae bacterium]